MIVFDFHGQPNIMLLHPF